MLRKVIKIFRISSKKLIPAAIIGLFAGLGAITLISTRASTQSTSVEAETGRRDGGTELVTDANTSGGQHVRFKRIVTPPGSAPITGTKVWIDDNEDNNVVDEWGRDGGGGFYNSGVFEAQSLSTAFARTGSHSQKMTVTTPPTAGVRSFRWKESRENRDLFFEAWLYIPQKLRLTQDANSGQFWNLMQWKSRSCQNCSVDPLWAIYGQQDSAGIFAQLGWGWGGISTVGPHSNSGIGGEWIAPKNKIYLPTGKWVQLAAYMHQSKDFDGSMKVWVDGVLIADLSNIKTSYNNCTYNIWCTDSEWSINHYSDGILPSTSTIYWDDAALYRP